MVTKRICDSCGKVIPTFNEMLQDTIDEEYPGRDICPECDGSIKLGEAIARESIIQKRSPEEILRNMAKMYDVDVS